MSKTSMITYLMLWATILLQRLTIRDLKKWLENEKQWTEWWQNKWLEERNKRRAVQHWRSWSNKYDKESTNHRTEAW